MSFKATIIVRTGENSGPTYNLYGCVGNVCSTTPLNPSPVTIVSDVPFVVQNIPFGITSLKIESIGTCTNSVILPIKNAPLPTPTPTPTVTPTPTLTPTPGASLTPTPTPTITTTPDVALSPTPTPTPTTSAEVTYTCGDTISETTTTSSFVIYSYNLNFTQLSGGDTININYSAGDRPNNFQIFDNNGVLVIQSGWVGSDNTYYGGPWIYPENINPISTGTISFVYNSSKTYTLTVLVGNANPNNVLNDNFTATIQCIPVPTTNTFINTGTNGTIIVSGTPYTIFLTSSLFTMSPNPLTNFNGPTSTINFINGQQFSGSTLEFTLNGTTTATRFTNLQIRDNLNTTYTGVATGGSGTGNNVKITFNVGTTLGRTFRFNGGEINLNYI